MCLENEYLLSINLVLQSTLSKVDFWGWGGDSAYERGGDARLKFLIKPLKENNLGVARAFFGPLKETMLKHRQYNIFTFFSRATLNETFTAKHDSVLPRTP